MTETDLKRFSEKSYSKVITRVNERIYHFLGYGHSNATVVIGNSSVILIDCLDCDIHALSLREEIEKITDKPVKTLIYTHSHPDHRGGAGIFKDTLKEVIDFLPSKTTMKYYDRLQSVLNRRGSYQFGYELSDEEAISQGIGIREGTTHGGQRVFVSATTRYQEKEVSRIIDGVPLKLVSAPGETDDQIFVWLEEDDTLCCADNYYGCFPALYAIRGTPYRDIVQWIDSLTEILSYEPSALLPGHTKPLLGKELIAKQVGTFKEMMEYLLFNTLECMNQGLTLAQTVAKVQLPKRFKDADYLGEYYGMVEWAVKSIYTGYVGWFDGDPVHLLPVDEEVYHETLRFLIGTEKLTTHIRALMKDEQYQLALQLLELVDEPQLKKICLLERAKQVSSANARHYYICSAKEIS